ncbi:MAG: AmmeMemoRadiSam system protein B [Bryobacteraceae bacterium]|nr:AmmeMemoRadiSam system protein B [Bryobacteraceae bacterium]
MAELLPRLRMNLDFMPSPVAGKPGLLIRDPYGFSDATLIIPPGLVSAVELFDGESSSLDLREFLARLTGDLDTGSLERHLIETLASAGFLEDETYERMREARARAFADSPVRRAAHAGSGYPEDAAELRMELDRNLGASLGRDTDSLVGIAAPHVSPFGGWSSYRAAYQSLSAAYSDRTFVVLGTSHYGEPDVLGLTRKPFATPYGVTTAAGELVDLLEAKGGSSVRMEDYCHAIEHSIEFQVVMLQHLYGPDVKVLPVLCGSFAGSLYEGNVPETSETAARALDALGELAAREGDRLFWVLGVDMAHIGRRYGDAVEARADEGEMVVVASRDRERISRIEAGDAAGFWSLVSENQDPLKWCGSAPLYAFLRAMAGVRGELKHYEQWNIDAQSVVSFSGMSFSR